MELDKEYTVGQLVDVILSRAGTLREWAISAFTMADARLGTGSMPSEFLAKKVVKVKADGGWSRMDYLIWVE